MSGPQLITLVLLALLTAVVLTAGLCRLEGREVEDE